ncbi:hypothetical protein CTRI78_v002009 [Colletotrichum trifolii]|uniref:Uncharacterized protein n=1 Tax=Colletotrichum trifolii TaxID=5466 RepID=A0A4R8RMK0_COLTR|nr:hypothetical protein CTRI78_v002009 [Colletotrichum trifolii]
MPLNKQGTARLFKYAKRIEQMKQTESGKVCFPERPTDTSGPPDLEDKPDMGTNSTLSKQSRRSPARELAREHAHGPRSGPGTSSIAEKTGQEKNDTQIDPSDHESIMNTPNNSNGQYSQDPDWHKKGRLETGSNERIAARETDSSQASPNVRCF